MVVFCERIARSNHAQRPASILSVLLAVLLLLNSAAAANTGDIQFRIDRDSIALGESFQLLGEKELSNGTFRGKKPDFEALYKDFDIINYRSPGSGGTFSFGGNMRTLLKWVVTLRPKRSGTLTVPSVVIGGQRTPVFQIKVGERRQTIAEDKLEAIFVQNDMQSTSGYVQEHLTYSVRLYVVKNYPLESGQVEMPAFADALVVPLGEQSSYEVTFGRYNFQVLEWLYAVVPQKAGPLELAAPTVIAEVLQANGMFQETVSAERKGKPLVLNIAPAKQQPWRPAQLLSLNWKAGGGQTRKVGEGFTLELVAKGQGILASQLPKLTLPEFTGLKVYPDKPEILERAIQGVMHSEYRQKWAVVPTQGGQLQLPRVTADWWSLPQDQAMQAVAESLSLTIAGAAAPIASEEPNTAEPVTNASEAAAAVIPNRWLLLLLPCWLASLALTAWLTARWLKSTETKSAAEKPHAEIADLASLKKQFLKACKANDVARAAACLERGQRLMSNQAVATGTPLASLEARASQLGESAAVALRTLQQLQYGKAEQQAGAVTWDGKQAATLLAPLLVMPVNTANAAASMTGQLAPLYSA